MNTALVLLSLVALPAVVMSWDVENVNEFCFSIQNRRNQKDLYADESDCHRYIQCFYLNETSAVGFTRECQAGLFWHEPVLACMPEGETPCVDACLDDATAAKGCYAGAGCRQYFTCSNTGSNGMCCPEGTQFDEETCSCVESVECSDFCTQVAPLVATTVAAPEAVNSSVCQDSFGSLVAISEDEDNAFFLVDDEGHASTKLYCPAGYSFSLESCRCDVESGIDLPEPTPARYASLYLSFDDDASDHSVNAHNVELVGGATRDSDAAVGAGSLLVNGGHAEIAAFKNFDWRNHGSFAAFFKCDGSCSGGIFSNRAADDNDQFTVAVGANGDSVQGQVNLAAPVGTLDIAADLPDGEWHHVAVTYDSNQVVTYINGEAVQTQFIAGFLATSYAPFTVGDDQVFGSFNGRIDEVLITPFAMTAEEVQMHRDGNVDELSFF